MSHKNRRDFIKTSVGGTVGIALAGVGAKSKATEGAESRSVRIGIVGVGGRGNSLMGNLLLMKNVEIRALCDLSEGKVAAAQNRVVMSGNDEGNARRIRRFCGGRRKSKSVCYRTLICGQGNGEENSGMDVDLRK